MTCDVSKREAVQSLVAQVIKEHGHIDILVNNAGTLIFKNFEDETEADWDASLGVNLKGPFLLSQAVVPYMKKQGDGKNNLHLISCCNKRRCWGDFLFCKQGWDSRDGAVYGCGVGTIWH